MSKHHAVEDDPQSRDMSWIRGLSAAANPVQPDALAPNHLSPAPRAPRHAAPVDEPGSADEGGPGTTDLRGDIPAALQTGPRDQISAEPADVIAPLAGVLESDDFDESDQPVDVGLDLFGISDDDTPNDAGGSVGQASPVRDTPLPLTPTTDIVPRPLTTPRRGRLRKPVLLGAAAALLLLTVGGGAMAGGTDGNGAAGNGSGTATMSDKTVVIVVDGRPKKMTTFANSVAGALVAAGITPNSHDTLAPGAGAPISDGSTIVLNRGRLLTLTIDGRQRQIWTTARTVNDALAQLGVSGSDWLLSANRSRAIPLTGLSVSGATLHTVSMSVAGTALASSTTAAKTVGDLLTQQEIMLSPLDRISPALGTKLSDGLVITVERVVLSTTTTAVALPQPAAQTVPDATIATGTSKITQQGRPGSALITYSVTSVDGRQSTSFEQGRSTAVAPVGTITHVGTGPNFTYVGNQVLTNDTSFGVNWDGLAMCESTHNPKAINANPVAGLPTYGMFQFDLPTWASVGGSGNPIDATPQEQLMRAKLLFQQRGLEPWACRDAAH